MVEDCSPCPHGVWAFTEKSVMAASRMRRDVTCVLPGMASMVLALELSGFSAGRPKAPELHIEAVMSSRRAG